MINAEAVNSVTERKPGGRPSILTKDVMAGIPVLVQQGLNAEAIAARLCSHCLLYTSDAADEL